MTRGRIVKLSEEEARALRARMRGEASEVDWTAQPVLAAPRKIAISVRVDEDVLAFFRAEGAGYQTRMNAVLRSYMLAKTGKSTERP
ncbi:MAG: hypothetical protein RIR62_2278 [Pseudomonadota bacterium]